LKLKVNQPAEATAPGEVFGSSSDRG